VKSPRSGRKAKFITRALLVLVGLSLLFAIGSHVDGNHAGMIERRIFRALNELPGVPYRPTWVVMQFGNLVLVPVAAIVAVVLRRFRLAIAIALVGVGKWYSSRVIKDWFLRERPAQVIEDVILRDAPAAGQAFVSGHAVIAVGVATVLHPYLSRRWRIVSWTVAGLVCIARVHVGAHLPLDVVAGAAVGAGLGSLANLLVDGAAALLRSKPDPTGSGIHPPGRDATSAT
jgi:membrane-associated phospholipid phosphatase